MILKSVIISFFENFHPSLFFCIIIILWNNPVYKHIIFKKVHFLFSFFRFAFWKYCLFNHFCIKYSFIFISTLSKIFLFFFRIIFCEIIIFLIQIFSLTALSLWLFSIEAWFLIEFFYLLYLFIGTIYFIIIIFFFKYKEGFFSEYQKNMSLFLFVTLFLLFGVFEDNFETPLVFLFCIVSILFNYYYNYKSVKKITLKKTPQEIINCLEKSAETTKLEIEKLRIYYKSNPHILELKFDDESTKNK